MIFHILSGHKVYFNLKMDEQNPSFLILESHNFIYQICVLLQEEFLYRHDSQPYRISIFSTNHARKSFDFQLHKNKFFLGLYNSKYGLEVSPNSTVQTFIQF